MHQVRNISQPPFSSHAVKSKYTIVPHVDLHLARPNATQMSQPWLRTLRTLQQGQDISCTHQPSPHGNKVKITKIRGAASRARPGIATRETGVMQGWQADHWLFDSWKLQAMAQRPE